MRLPGRVKHITRDALRDAASGFLARTDDQTHVRDRRDTQGARLLMAFTLRPDANCVDIGAHSGHFLREMVALAPNGHHIAFEPIADLAKQLAVDFPNVDVRNAAASDRAGSVSFTYVPEAPGYSGFREREYPIATHPQEITVDAVRLDDALPPDYVPRFLKVDVEGAELEVFRGAKGLLQRHQPTVLFEHGRGAADRYGTAPGDVFELLAGELSYRLFDLDGGGPYDRQSFERAFESGSHWNFAAIGT